jgi:hypothetical protein
MRAPQDRFIFQRDLNRWGKPAHGVGDHLNTAPPAMHERCQNLLADDEALDRDIPVWSADHCSGGETVDFVQKYHRVLGCGCAQSPRWRSVPDRAVILGHG